MARISKNHPINSTDFYPLTPEELKYIRKIRCRHWILFSIIGIIIIIAAAVMSFYIGGIKGADAGIISFPVISALGWLILIITCFHMLRKPAGGRYASILSCYTTTDTFGTGEDTIRSTYYNFSVRFNDTGETIEPFIAEMYAATLETGSRVFLVKNKRSDYDIFSADEMAVSGVHIPPLS